MGKYIRNKSFIFLLICVFAIVFLYLCFMGTYIKEPKNIINYYVSKGTNKSEWKGIENLRFTQHIPSKDVLMKQVLIQKHDDLIKDIHILYYEMGLIQKKK